MNGPIVSTGTSGHEAAWLVGATFAVVGEVDGLERVVKPLGGDGAGEGANVKLGIEDGGSTLAAEADSMAGP